MRNKEVKFKLETNNFLIPYSLFLISYSLRTAMGKTALPISVLSE